MNCQDKLTTVVDCYFWDYLEDIRGKIDVTNNQSSAKNHNP